MSDKWYRKSCDPSGTMISTRVRLARNLSAYPFPFRMTTEQRQEVATLVTEAAERLGGLSLRCLDLSACAARDRLAMTERHVISHEFASKGEGVLLLSEDESISIMINEEDHVRIQVMCPGMDFETAYTLADQIDTALDEQLHFAFDERLGYLTQCPTNLGTGMRASVMLHLPALQENGLISSLSNRVAKLGMVVRGAYGEGTEPIGALYQLSNQTTMGISEGTAIENLRDIAKEIAEKEVALRKKCLRDDVYEDAIWRSLGVLKTARLLTTGEAMECLSRLMIGAAEGLFSNASTETLTALMKDVQPGCLMSDAGEDMSLQVRDRRRAALVRTACGEWK